MPLISETSERRVPVQGSRLDLPASGAHRRGAPQRDRPQGQRPQGQRRRGQPPGAARWRQVGLGLGLAGAGTTILAALMQIPQRFDGLLLVSNAIANVIGGLHRLGGGLLQLVGVLVVALLAVLALLLLVGGLVRIVRAVGGRSVSRGAGPARIRPVATTTRGS